MGAYAGHDDDALRNATRNEARTLCMISFHNNIMKLSFHIPSFNLISYDIGDENYRMYGTW